MKAYIAGSLTLHPQGREKAKAIYHKAAIICSNLGIETIEPWQATEAFYQTDPQRLYKHDRNLFRQCDLLIAYTEYPSHGVGQEVEIAHQNKTKIIFLHPRGKALTALMKGNPSVIKIIEYQSQSDLHKQLSQTLQELLKGG